jgi:hypothetical protein
MDSVLPPPQASSKVAKTEIVRCLTMRFPEFRIENNGLWVMFMSLSRVFGSQVRR